MTDNPLYLNPEIANYRRSLATLNDFSIQELHQKPKFFDWVKCSVDSGCEYQMYLGGGDDGVALRFFWNGQYEYKTLELWAKLARYARTIIDIGAHTGAYSLAAWTANSSARVFSFEPHFVNFSRLNLNLRANKVPTSKSFMVACSDKEHIAPFSVTTHYDYLSTGGSLGKRKNALTSFVQVVSLDKVFYEKGDFILDLVKIDVEGHEPECLNGMKKLITQGRPTVFLECVHPQSSKVAQIALEEHGYIFFLIDDKLGSVQEVDVLEPILNTSGEVEMSKLNRLIIHQSRVEEVRKVLSI